VRLKILGAALLCLFVAALPAESQPLIRIFGVQNAASNASASQFGRGLARGSIFVVKGARFGPPELLQAVQPYPSQLPEGEGGTRITITPVESGVPTDTELIYTWEWQAAGIVPLETPLGPADVTVSWQGETSEPTRIEILATAPALFTQGMTGYGPGVIQNYNSADNQPLNSLTGPARPGQYLILWGTGLGRSGNPFFGWVFEIELGGLTLTPSYTGPAPGYPGLDQINVRLPDDGSLPEGCYTELRIRSGLNVSPPVTVSTAREPGACRHPMNLSLETLARLDAGGRVPLANLSIWQNQFQDRDGNVYADLVSVAATELAGMTPGMTAPDMPLGCARVTGVFPVAVLRVGDFTPLPPPLNPNLPLDVGESLMLSGPGGSSLSLTRNPDQPASSRYLAERPPLGFFAPGDWTITAPGGADTGSFAATVTLSPIPEPEIPATLDRTEDFPVSWPTEGFAPHELVSVTVSSHTRLDGEPHIEDAATLRCIAPATAGAVTFPAALLAELRSLDNGVVNVNVVPAPDNRTTFTAPGIEYGNFTWSRSVFQQIEIN
jgi:uncharacterized protein (TIGR03437 family)